MSTPFDYVNSINDKKYISDLYKGYDQYIINLAYSYHIDTVLFANEMNLKSNLTNEMHYDFYYHVLRKAKRYSKWNKKDKNIEENLSFISQYYQINKEKAKEILNILSEDELKKIKTSKGGNND